MPADSTGLTIYFGGDGRPWAGDKPSDNPTGSGVLAAELALADPRPALFLGRPCYHLTELPQQCSADLWTAGRYSEEIVAAMASAVTQIAARPGSTPLSLVGYSGGGVLALLVAGRVPAVREVITVAANLDTSAWTDFHGLLPLDGSLNPARELRSPTAFRQVHLYGTGDRIVPAGTIAGYRRRHPTASYLQVEGFDHRCCWREQWPAILERVEALHQTSAAPRPPDAP